jgi:hypothetical protein
MPAPEYSDFVAHPRFGKGPRQTGCDPKNAADGSVHLDWHSGPGVRIPGTAIVANLVNQSPATVPVTHYFDAKRVCRACSRQFLFFAQEQEHWYEELQFPLEADCLECMPCRKAEQQLQVAQRKYAALLSSGARSEIETLALVECGVLLVEAAVFSKKALPRLRGFIKPLFAAPPSAHRTQAVALQARIAAVEARDDA